MVINIYKEALFSYNMKKMFGYEKIEGLEAQDIIEMSMDDAIDSYNKRFEVLDGN